ncbi:MAG: hypothetical protein FWE15_27500, partial [Actinomycetia bacterium]|nr:hypothetical protein [Actinomycetes bacterium]
MSHLKRRTFLSGITGAVALTAVGTQARAAGGGDGGSPAPAFSVVRKGSAGATVLWWGGATAQFAAGELAGYVE